MYTIAAFHQREGVSKGHPLLFIWIMFISFAPPKEMNQRKGGRKRQPHPVFRLLRNAIFRSKKQGAVRAFSGLPTRHHKT
jgi:hypothetical protein